MRDNENHQVRNGLLLLAILFLISEGFRKGHLTWERIIIGVGVLFAFSQIVNYFQQ